MILDTGLAVAVLDERDIHHHEALLFLTHTPERVIMPAPVVFETAQFVGGKRGLRLGPIAEAQALEKTAAMGVTDPIVDDYERAIMLLTQYADQDGGKGIGVVDALVVAMAERLGVTKVATYDRKHFSVIRPKHVDRFELYP